MHIGLAYDFESYVPARCPSQHKRAGAASDDADAVPRNRRFRPTPKMAMATGESSAILHGMEKKCLEAARLSDPRCRVGLQGLSLVQARARGRRYAARGHELAYESVHVGKSRSAGASACAMASSFMKVIATSVNVRPSLSMSRRRAKGVNADPHPERGGHIGGGGPLRQVLVGEQRAPEGLGARLVRVEVRRRDKGGRACWR